MARRKIKKIPSKKTFKINKNGIFSRLNFSQSYTSLILGAIVVLVIGILFVLVAKGNKNWQQTSSTDTTRTEQEQNANTSSTYTIRPGDDLWSISESIYKDGYKWVEIARINNLENPGVIHVGNKLTLPKISPVVNASITPEPTQKTQSMITQNNSITGTTYKIKEGDNLWDICVRAYGDGYKWVEIARVNNLENPDLIHSDNILNLPR